LSEISEEDDIISMVSERQKKGGSHKKKVKPAGQGKLST